MDPTTELKVGDKVRRKPEFTNGFVLGDTVCAVRNVDHSCGWMWLDGMEGGVFISRFDKVEDAPATKASDGSSTDYYLLPPGAGDLLDLIEHKKMSFALGNIFKACYRLGEKRGVDLTYDLNKIIFFAERMKAGLK
jgi:hypothetical protein